MKLEWQPKPTLFNPQPGSLKTEAPPCTTVAALPLQTLNTVQRYWRGVGGEPGEDFYDTVIGGCWALQRVLIPSNASLLPVLHAPCMYLFVSVDVLFFLCHPLVKNNGVIWVEWTQNGCLLPDL